VYFVVVELNPLWFTLRKEKDFEKYTILLVYAWYCVCKTEFNRNYVKKTMLN